MKTFEDFYKEFQLIKSKGFIETLRKGPTGAGYTFEQLLGLIENSMSLPDFIDFLTELKTKRLSSKSSLLTLYTDDSAWTIPQIDFLEQYGWNHSKHIGEKTAQCTIRSKVNKRGFSLDVTDSDYLMVCKNNAPFIQWKRENISQHYMDKFENLIVVDVKVKKVGDTEYVHFVGFNHYQGTSIEKFYDALEKGLIAVDLRLYTQYNLNKSVRNRGTALRIKHKDVFKLYDSQEYYT